MRHYFEHRSRFQDLFLFVDTEKFPTIDTLDKYVQRVIEPDKSYVGQVFLNIAADLYGLSIQVYGFNMNAAKTEVTGLCEEKCLKYPTMVRSGLIVERHRVYMVMFKEHYEWMMAIENNGASLSGGPGKGSVITDDVDSKDTSCPQPDASFNVQVQISIYKK